MLHEPSMWTTVGRRALAAGSRRALKIGDEGMRRTKNANSTQTEHGGALKFPGIVMNFPSYTCPEGR